MGDSGMSERDSHETVRDLSGAAARRLLTPDEARFVVTHLWACESCRAAYHELARTAELLVWPPDPVEPPPGLRARIMAEIARTPQDAPVAPPASAGPAPPPTPITAAGRRRPFGPRDLGLVASLAAAVVFGITTLRLQADVAAQAARLAQQERLVQAAARGRVVPLVATGQAPQVRGAVADGPEGAAVYLSDLPTPPADHVYQVWLIPPGGQPVGAGLSRPGEGGTQSIPIERSLAGLQTVAITLEPAGGSPGPTTPVLAVANL